jgi:hypothetical protein
VVVFVGHTKFETIGAWGEVDLTTVCDACSTLE